MESSAAHSAPLGPLGHPYGLSQPQPQLQAGLTHNPIMAMQAQATAEESPRKKNRETVSFAL